MGYKIGQVKEVSRRIEFELPVSEGDAPLKADFLVRLRVRDVEKRKQRIDKYQELLQNGVRVATTVTELDEGFIREDVVWIRGILDENGEEVPYNEGVLDSVLNDPSARVALLEGWKELNLEGAVKRKN